MASHDKIVGHDKSRGRHQCLSPLCSLCYLLFKTSSIASVGEALGFWRGDSINRGSGMTKDAAVPSANPVPQSPSFPLLPSVQNLFGCFCGRGAWLLAWRFEKPRVGHDKSRGRPECESSASVSFVPFATFCSKLLRLLLWARRLVRRPVYPVSRLPGSGFRSSTATASISAVCGNMSKGWMATIS
jgi:hypothetical protein